MRHLALCFMIIALSGTLLAQMGATDTSSHKSDATMASGAGDDLTNPFSDNAASSQDGAAIYAIHCASCHGADGHGTGPAGTYVLPTPDNLTNDDTHAKSDGALFLGIGDGAHGVMIPWKFILSENQRWHLVDYIRDLRTHSTK